jgi:LuxR family maltose regulon positive regulatory protein
VPRRPLFERLSAAGPRGVTVVAAPPGSGKTALLRSWIAHDGFGDRVAWVSVERGERDAQRFWLSIIGELSGAVDGDWSVRKLSATPGFDGGAVVERLVSDLAALEVPVVLVIDDLHELSAPDALAQLEFLLTRLPAELRVVLATRRDPRLGLHRLRLAGELTELRPSDLRFTLQETRDLLEAAGIVLSEGGLALLHDRSEGWAAGLRLAAMGLAGHPEPERFVAEFSGSERTVADYLLAEVLDRQPEEVRHLLLRTSLLERVSGPLADVLTGGSGSERLLQGLEEASAFVVSLDVGRSWFRYHHLFADLLRLELRRTAPDEVSRLHRAAAQWFEEQGHVVDAVAHAQAAGEWADAARLLADNMVSLSLDGRMAAIRAQLAAFPADASAANAELAASFAGVELELGSLDAAAAYLAVAQRLSAVVPDERRRRFDMQLALFTLSLARRRGDLATALEQAQSLEAAMEAGTSSAVPFSADVRASALMSVGIVELWSSRADDARRDLEQALALSRRIGRPWLEIGCLSHLAMAAARHSLPLGRRPCEEAIEIAETHGWGANPVVAQALAMLGGTLVAAGRFAEAEHWLDRAERVLHPEAEPATGVTLHHARGLIYAGRGRLEQALAAFRAAQDLQALLVTNDVLGREPRGSLMLRSSLLLTRVRLGETGAVRAELATLGEQERGAGELRTVLAAAYLAEGSPQRAVEAHAPVIEGSAPVLHPLSFILALLFDAAAHDQLGDPRSAEAQLERALELAEPDGTILPFTMTPVGGLLERHPKRRTVHAALLSDIRDVLAGSQPAARRGELASMGQQLSAAELRVVRYLPTNLKAPEIAAELGVSANTVKTHLRHIYDKLNAHSRSEAVDRARELGLLARSAVLR